MMCLPVEDVQHYPRPPALEPVAQHLRVLLGGQVVAETVAGFRVLETHHAPTYYLPPGDVLADLIPARGRSVCEWKGIAAYWDVRSGDVMAPRAAWSYARPTPGYSQIADYVAFYAGAMEACWVGEARVIPQPGDFYGGWVTANLTGRIKGQPGTEHW